MIEKKCLKIVASWAFGVELKFLDLKYKDFSVFDFIKLGISRGYYCGTFHNYFDEDDQIVGCEQPLFDNKALVIIKSDKSDGSHALYWDGERLMNPEGGGYEELLDGIADKLISWIPITEVTKNFGVIK